jgi:dipeptidyl aminopeptidase/acylaminoacyl peptidase
MPAKARRKARAPTRPRISSRTGKATARRAPAPQRVPARRGPTLKDLVGLPTYALPALSHARDQVSFFLDTTGRQELYVSPLDRPKARQLSHGEVSRSLRSGTVWDRKDRSIFFAKDVQGNENHDLYRIRLDNGHVERITTDPSSEKHAVDISPDDRFLLVLGNIAGKGGRRQLNLWQEDLRNGELTQLTDYVNPVGFWGMQSSFYSPDGHWITFSTNEVDDPKNEDIYRMRSDGTGAERILRVKEGSKEGPADWSPDGRMLAISSDATGTTRPGLFQLDSQEVRWLGRPGRDESSVEFSPDGRWLLTFSQTGVEIAPHLYEVASGDEVPLHLPPGAYYSGQFTGDSSAIVLMHTDVHVPHHLLRYDLKSHATKVLFAPIYGRVDPKQLVPCETVRYPSFDGRPIEALLFRPRSPGAGGRTRGPALVEVHGGPTWQYFRVFNPYAQFLASQGYTVLEPNVRGSTGYGVEFRDLNRLDWGGGDLEDVAKGAEFLRGLPGVDPDRVGVFGGSYGGYMTYIATTKKPDLWKAACAIVGISDLQLMWDGSKEHFRYFLREQMGDPVGQAALWRDRSAVHFAQNLRAKLLILHGVNDPRCPVNQARAFRDRLVASGRKEGKDFEYEEYGDEGHGSSDIQQKLRMWGRMVEFFDRTL